MSMDYDFKGFQVGIQKNLAQRELNQVLKAINYLRQIKKLFITS